MSPEEAARALLGPVGNKKELGGGSSNKALEDLLEKSKSVKEIKDSLDEINDQFEKVLKILEEQKKKPTGKKESTDFATTIQNNMSKRQPEEGLNSGTAKTLENTIQNNMSKSQPKAARVLLGPVGNKKELDGDSSNTSLKDLLEKSKSIKEKPTTQEEPRDLAKTIQSNMSRNQPEEGLNSGIAKKLEEMADEATSGHSLRVQDFYVAKQLTSIHQTLQDIGKVIMGGKADFNRPMEEFVKEEKRGRKAATAPAATAPTTMTPTTPVTPMGAEKVITTKTKTIIDAKSIKSAEKSVAKTAEEIGHVNDVLDSLASKAGTYARRVGIDVETFIDFLAMAQESNRISLTTANNLEATFKNWEHVSKKEKEAIRIMMQSAERVHKDAEGTDAAYGRVLTSMEAIAKVGSKFNDTLVTKMRNLAEAAGNIGKVASYGALSSYGIGEGINIDQNKMFKEGAEWVMEISSAMHDVSTSFGNVIGQTDTWQKQVFDIGANINEIYLETGQVADVSRKQLLKNFRRGITDQEKWNKVTKTGLSLATLISSEAGSTADEMATWHQQMGLSVTQAQILARNIREVGQVTGVTGDNLIQAVKSGRALAESMRSVGTLTNDANRILIQYSAAAGKLGVEQTLNPLMKAMTSMPNWVRASTEDKALLNAIAQFAGRPELIAKIATGTMFTGKDAFENGKAMAEGMRNMVEQLSKQIIGKSYKDIDAREKNFLSMITEGMFGEGKGAGELLRAADALEETYTTVPEKIAKKRAEIEGLKKGPVTLEGMRQQKDIQTELENLVKQEDRADFTKAISDLEKVDFSKTADVEDKLRKAIEKYNKITGLQVGMPQDLTIKTVEDLTKQMTTDMERRDVRAKKTQLDVYTDTLDKVRQTNMITQQAAETAFNYMTNKVGPTALYAGEVAAASAKKFEEVIGKFASVIEGFRSAILMLTGSSIFQNLGRALPGASTPGAGGAMLGLGAAAAISVASAIVKINADRVQIEQRGRDIDRQIADIAENERATQKDREAAASKMTKEELAAAEKKLGQIYKNINRQTEDLVTEHNEIMNSRTGAGGKVPFFGPWNAANEEKRFQKEMDFRKSELDRVRREEALLMKRKAELEPEKAPDMLKQAQDLEDRAREAAAESERLRTSYQARWFKGTDEAQRELSMAMQKGAEANELMEQATVIRKGLEGSPALKKLGNMADEATKKESIYTHDIHLEELLGPVRDMANMIMPLVKPEVETLSPEESDDSIRRRVQQEHASAPSSASMEMANSALEDIADDTRAQTELMRKQLDELRKIVDSLQLTSSVIPAGETASNIMPASPANYYNWAYATIANPNKGGIENYPRH